MVTNESQHGHFAASNITNLSSKWWIVNDVNEDVCKCSLVFPRDDMTPAGKIPNFPTIDEDREIIESTSVRPASSLDLLFEDSSRIHANHEERRMRKETDKGQNLQLLPRFEPFPKLNRGSATRNARLTKSSSSAIKRSHVLKEQGAVAVMPPSTLCKHQSPNPIGGIGIFSKIGSQKSVLNPSGGYNIEELKRRTQGMLFSVDLNEALCSETMNHVYRYTQNQTNLKELVSNNFLSVLSVYTLIIGGNDELNESSLAAFNTLFHIAKSPGYQTLLLENDYVFCACFAVLLGRSMADRLDKRIAWCSVRGYHCPMLKCDYGSGFFFDYGGKEMIALNIIEAVVSKPNQKYIKASKLWDRVINGGCLATLLVVAAGKGGEFQLQKGVKWNIIHDLCELFLDGFPCDENLCDKLHLVGVYDAGNGVDKNGEIAHGVISPVQQKAKDILFNNFTEGDFHLFMRKTDESHFVDKDRGFPVDHSIDSKIKGLLCLVDLKIHAYLNVPVTKNIIIHSYRQTLERKRRHKAYEMRLMLYKQNNVIDQIAATRRKCNNLIQNLKDHCERPLHPLRAILKKEENRDQSKRSKLLYQCFLDCAVTFRYCKYRTKLENGVRVVEPHQWTYSKISRVWTRACREGTGPISIRCRFCFRSVQNAKESDLWFLSLNCLGKHFEEFLRKNFGLSCIKKYFPNLFDTIIETKKCLAHYNGKRDSSRHESLGLFLSRTDFFFRKFGRPSRQINELGWVDVKLV